MKLTENEELRIKVNGWRFIAIVLILGYVAIWANTYIFGGVPA